MQNIRQAFFIFFISLSFLLTAQAIWAHGVIESPASREQFCGVESKPDEIFKDKMTHEECRPIMTKEDGTLDNSVYNFMAVLTHTIGRSTKAVDQLPSHVCGFNSEMWSGGKTPWDKPNNWPTNVIAGGQQKFVWNISWGNHFGDTEEFVYWITKPDFKFDPTKELTWDDFEATPFCKLKYNDQTPNANPNVVPDKVNNRFITTCTVPTRQNRSVIYGEWGRNSYTYERFHSCIDVVFSSNTPSDIKAVISSLPAEVTGSTELQLDASNSVGTNLTYQWSIDAENLTPYQLQNSQSAKAKLLISNINAQQQVTINLIIKQNQTSNRASVKFIHLPAAVNATWKTIGRATLDSTLQAGDKIKLRLIDNTGKDNFIPSTPLVLTDETAKPDAWAYALAQVVNPDNDFSAKIGVLSSNNKTIVPIKSATENMMYVPNNSTIINAFIQVEKSTGPTQGCVSERKSGSSSYWLGYDIYAIKVPILLDFKSTGIDLTKIIVDKGVFSNIQILDKDRLLISTKPDWVNKTTPGYLGFFGPNYGPYEPFNSPINANCQTDNVLKKRK